MRIVDYDGMRNRSILFQAVEELETTLRRATADDVPSILALERATPELAHWSEVSYQTVFQSVSAERVAFVIEDEGGLHGFVLGRFSSDECELESMVVSEADRRRGLGLQLLQALMREARLRQMRRILLEVRESNLPARALYEKCGFNTIGKRKSYYRDPAEGAVLYALTL
jgi:ribosomal-protein-alanine N-acetyltransferase